MRRRTWVALTILALVVVGIWILLDPATPSVLAQRAIISDEHVVVSDNGWLLFEPAASSPEVGLVFYPGGLVPAEAYAPLARAIATDGYLVAVPRVPLNLAVFAPSAAGDVLSGHPEIDIWAVGGHSLGGAMAAGYASGSDVAGLVMVAAYPSGAVDLSAEDIDVLVIYGTEDGLFAADELSSSLDRYPSDTQIVVVQGGNHAQFGSYGSQRGDNQALIPESDQLSQTAAAVVSFLESLES